MPAAIHHGTTATKLTAQGKGLKDTNEKVDAFSRALQFVCHMKPTPRLSDLKLCWRAYFHTHAPLLKWQSNTGGVVRAMKGNKGSIYATHNFAQMYLYCTLAAVYAYTVMLKLLDCRNAKNEGELSPAV